MIELRWYSPAVAPGSNPYRRLQFRTQSIGYEFGGKAGPLKRWIWSEWQDVPEVTDELSAAHESRSDK